MCFGHHVLEFACGRNRPRGSLGMYWVYWGIPESVHSNFCRITTRKNCEVGKGFGTPKADGSATTTTGFPTSIGHGCTRTPIYTKSFSLVWTSLHRGLSTLWPQSSFWPRQVFWGVGVLWNSPVLWSPILRLRISSLAPLLIYGLNERLLLDPIISNASKYGRHILF